MRDPIVVLKFESSVLIDESALPAAVLEIYREIRRGRRVVAVVSAFGSTTDDLLERARGRFGEPGPACLARLLETGDVAAAATVGLALDQAGVPARVLDAVQIGLTTSADLLDAEPLAFATSSVLDVLAAVPVVVVPGFSGRSEDGNPALLGRGGSDLTAVFLAQGLQAVECRLLKDVCGLLRVREDGSLDHDIRYATAHYDECLQVGRPLVQPKAVEFAARHGMTFTISRCGATGGTFIGPVVSSFERAVPVARRTRVCLAGLGTVGLGVFRWLSSLAEDFEIVGILVNDPARSRPEDVPRHLLTGEVDGLLAHDPDLVIEVIGGTGTAAELIRAALRRDLPVVSANKQLLALDLELLGALASSSATLAGSASVGGSVPVLETVAALAATDPIVAVEGILNGTCNFILDRLNDGDSWDEAMSDAQALGLVEADPYLDVSGLDCAYKLSILGTRAFGHPLTIDQVVYEGVDQVTDHQLAAAREQRGELKLVAQANRYLGSVEARVSLEPIPPDHPLAGCRRESNRLVVETASGKRVVVAGKGAGRWPTTVSVVCDVLERHRALMRRGGYRSVMATKVS